jgi:hypothetical protein
MKFPVTHFKCMVIMLGPDAYYAVVTSRFSPLHIKYLMDLSPWLRLYIYRIAELRHWVFLITASGAHVWLA